MRVLEGFFNKKSKKLHEGDVVIISSKIVALSQGKVVDLRTVRPGKMAQKMKRSRYGLGVEDPRMVELVLREADIVLPGSMMMAIKNNIIIPSGGIDRSNAPSGRVILWPDKPFHAAQNILKKLKEKFRLKKLGVVICDSSCRPLRWGTSGIAIGWAGFEGVQDIRGQKDIYGKRLRHTKKAVADNLASAALLLMGEAKERVPVVIARGAPAKFTNRMQKTGEIFVSPEKCLFGGIYSERFKKLLR